MKTTYTVKEGDTLDRISSRVYGFELGADRLRKSNPQLKGGLPVGMVLSVPPIVSITPAAQAETTAGRENEVSILIDGEPFHFWTQMRLIRTIDNVDAFVLEAPFEPENTAFVDTFVPLAYQEAQILVAGSTLFTGTVVGTPTAVATDGNFVAAEGYGLYGVLGDCPPPSDADIEFNQVDLKTIATALCEPFGLTPVFTGEPSAALLRVAIDRTGTVLPFLIRLAQQQNLVIGNTTRGMPLFQQATAEPPLQDLEEGVSPVTNVDLELQPQRYYSSVTGITPSTIAGDGAPINKENPHLKGVIRPYVYMAEDTVIGSNVDAVNAKAGRMFAGAMMWRVNVAGWRDARGELWAPNTRVNLLAPRARCKRQTEFLIQSVSLIRDPTSDTTELELVLPEAFEGGIPPVLPWQ